MSLDRIQQARKRIIGTNQTTKALQQYAVALIYVAKDAESNVVNPVISLAKEKGVPIEWVDSMKQLGKACGIEVGAATAAILEE